MIAVERGGKLKAQIRPDASAQEIGNFVRQNIKKGSFLMTDKARTYNNVEGEYERHAVNHGAGEYVRGPIHVNAVETFLAHLKRSIKGTFKSLSKQHLQSYLDSFVWHYNNRHNDNERFSSLLGVLLRSVR